MAAGAKIVVAAATKLPIGVAATLGRNQHPQAILIPRDGSKIGKEDQPVVLSNAYGLRTTPNVLPTECMADCAHSAK